MPRLLAISIAGLAVVWRFGISTASTQTHPRCRYIPGDAEWPGFAEWNTFNASLGGKLVKTIPIGSPCYRDQPFTAFDQAQCDQIQKSWNIPETHEETSSSIMASFPTNNSCNPFLGPIGQCVLGTYNQYTVRADRVSDIQKVVQFAQERNIRLTIRNSGHDYYGKSTGAGALAVWTKGLKAMELLDYDQSHYRGKAFKLGAAVNTREVSKFASDNGLVLSWGSSPTVGVVGGYLQGGGTNLLASQHGLAADNALEYEVVTAKGDLIKASPKKNKDLYFALSGGGGGTYGIVVSATVKAFPDRSSAAATVSVSGEGIDPNVFYGVVKGFLDSLPEYTKAGTATTMLLQPTVFSIGPMMGFGLTKSKLDDLLKPTMDVLSARNISYGESMCNFRPSSPLISSQNTIRLTILRTPTLTMLPTHSRLSTSSRWEVVSYRAASTPRNSYSHFAK